MAYSSIFNFYLPEVDDTNEIYVPGFQQNFEILETILSTIVTQSVVDVYAYETTALNRKKAITDKIVSKYQAHKDSIINYDISKNGKGSEYLNYLIENPHGISPDMLYYREDVKSGDSIGVLVPSGSYNPKKNMGHNAIVQTINNKTSDELTDRSLQINGVGKTEGVSQDVISGLITNNVVIDYSNLYLQDIGNNSDGTTYESQKEREDAKKYRNHKYLYVDIDNQVTDNYILSDGNAEFNMLRDKHLSLNDINHFESHIRNIGQFTSAYDIKKYADMQNDLGEVNINPHRVTAESLYDSYSDINDMKYGAQAIIRVINKKFKADEFSGPEAYKSWDKIYWEAIDKTSMVNDEYPKISDIYMHGHYLLSDILPADVNSTDEEFNKHVSNKQTKKWEDHVNTEFLNPHKTKASQLYTLDNTENGRIAIIEQINTGVVSSENFYSDKVSWTTINKDDIDGKGGKANIKDIPLREHDDLQGIKPLDLSSSTFEKLSHVSNTQMNTVFDFIKLSDSTNNQRIHTTSIIGTSKSKSQRINIPLSYIHTKNTTTIQFTISSIALQSELYLYVDLISSPNYNYDIYFNNYYLGQLQNQSSTFIIPNAHIFSKNNIVIYLNSDEYSEEMLEIISSLSYQTDIKYSGRDAIIDEINKTSSIDTDGYYKQIKWERVNKDGSSISDFTSKAHDLLTDIKYYNDNIDETNDKHINSKDGERWDTHVNTVNGENPHNTKIENLCGISEDRKGIYAIFDEINKYSLANNPNRSIDTVGDNYISWASISKKEITLLDLEEDGRSHQNLSKILPVSYIEDISSQNPEDLVSNKHISNVEASTFMNHVNTISNIEAEEQSLVNPHKITAASLYSHKIYDNYSNPDRNGGNAIVDAINDYADLRQINWKRINKDNSILTEITFREHSMLTDIKKPNENTSISGTIYDLHISQTEYNNWEIHRNSEDNPHNVAVSQLLSNYVGYNGVSGIVEEINNQQTSKNYIHHSAINFDAKEINNVSVDGFNIASIPNRDHDNLQNVKIITGEELIQETYGHVRSSQVSSWDSHMSNTENPHNVTGAQVELGLSLDEKNQYKITGDTIKEILLEESSYRNKPYVGLVSTVYPSGKEVDNPIYYFDTSYNLYVPRSVVMMNSEIEYKGQVSKYTTPVSADEDIDELPKSRFPEGCYKITKESLIERVANTNFVVYARLQDGAAVIDFGPEGTSDIDSQKVKLLSGYITVDTESNMILDGYVKAAERTALGLSEKLFSRIAQSERFHRQTGLKLEHDTLRNEQDMTTLAFFLTDGTIWEGVKYFATDTFFTRDSNEASKKVVLVERTTDATDLSLGPDDQRFRYITSFDSDGGTKIPITGAINHKYQAKTGGLVDVPSGKICINLIYYLPDYDKIYIVLSEVVLDNIEDYDRYANKVFPQYLPGIISSNSIFVGMLFCRQGNDETPVKIYSPFDVTFTATTTYASALDIKHSQLKDLVGNKPYYHLGTNEYNAIKFIFDTEPGPSGDTGFEAAIKKELIDKRIKEILKSESIVRLTSLKDMADMILLNKDNKVDKAGDTITGNIIISSNSDNAISVNSSSVAKINIGVFEVDSLSSGYSIKYENTSNKMSLTSHDGSEYFTVQGNNVSFQSNVNFADIVTNNIHVNSGLLSNNNINFGADINQYGLILGNITNQGTVIFTHNAENSYSVFRARNEKFEIDTYGNLYLNTDKSRSLSHINMLSADGKGNKYIENGSTYGASSIFIGNENDNMSPSYPIEIHPYSKTYLKYGAMFGDKTEFESDSGNENYILLLNGNIKLKNGSIHNAESIIFSDGSSIKGDDGVLSYATDNSRTIFKTTINNNSSKNEIFSMSIEDLYLNVRYNGAQAIKINKGGALELYYAGTKKIETSSTGARIKGDLIVDGEIVGSNETYSDERMKIFINPVHGVLDKIRNINAYEYLPNLEFMNKIGYTPTETDKVDYGFSANKMKELFPGVVKESKINKIIDSSKIDEPILTIEYEKLTAILWSAVCEQSNLIDELKKEIEKIKNSL